MTLIQIASNYKGTVKLLSQQDSRKFSGLSSRILDELPVDDPSALFSLEERQKLLSAMSLSSGTELSQMLSLLLDIWRQVAFHIIKPAVLQKELMESLGFPDDIAKNSAELWSMKAKDVVSRLKNHSTAPNQLKDVNWTLNVDVASSHRSRINEPKAVLELLVNDGEKGGNEERISLEMDHEQLYGMYEKLERIQGQLDSLMS